MSKTKEEEWVGSSQVELNMEDRTRVKGCKKHIEGQTVQKKKFFFLFLPIEVVIQVTVMDATSMKKCDAK